MAFKDPNTLINGVAYNYADMAVQIGGAELTYDGFAGQPVQSITYNKSVNKVAHYENSRYTTAYSYGKEEFSGNITFSLDSLEFLRDRIYSYLGDTSRSITDIPAIDITVTYRNEGKLTTHTIKNVTFTSEDHGGSEGDDMMTVSCDFIASYIVYGANGDTLPQTAVAIIETNQEDNQG